MTEMGHITSQQHSGVLLAACSSVQMYLKAWWATCSTAGILLLSAQRAM